MKFNFKSIAATMLLVASSVVSYAQNKHQVSAEHENHRTCSMDHYMEEKLVDPVFANEYQLLQEKFNEELIKTKQAKLSSVQYSMAAQATLIIPVAVHFPDANPADRACLVALAQSQVDVLNQDFTGTNPDIANWTPAVEAIYASTSTTTGSLDIEFVLATLNHPANTDPNLVEGEPAVTVGYNFGGGADADATWAGYKNFLVKDAGAGILGYSPLGGSIANGAAVVMSFAAFGSDAIAPGCTSNGFDYIPGAPYNLGRTTTHELGHFFNLDHTFNGGCAAPGDNIADTPAVANPTYGTPATGSVDGCVAGQKALTMNYMDYVNDSHMWMLSADQEDVVSAYLATQTFLTNVYPTDYVLNFTNTELNVCEGDAMAYTFDYDAEDGFTTQVDLTATITPATATVNLSQSSVTGDVSGIMAIVTGATAGNYTITVTGTYGSEVRDYTLELNVYNNSLTAPMLTSPADGMNSVATPFTLSWVANSNAASYDVEVATDSGFTSIIDTASVTTNQYNPSALNPLTEYFWRVRAVNTCMSTSYSVVRSFTTDVCSVCPSVGTTQYATSTTRVAFNTIDNPSGKPAGYSDYTAMSTDVLIGDAYDLIVQVNTDGDYAVNSIAWIDWNQNCVFEPATEEYDLGGVANQTDGPVANSPLSIIVPANAVLGATTMRVTTKYSASIGTDLPTSCEDAHDAEVEDYTINVLVPVPNYSFTATNSPIAVCATTDTNAVFDYDFSIVNGYSQNTTLAVTSGLSAGANAVISPTSMNGAGSFTMTVTGLTNFPAGDNTITITATGSDVKTVDVILNVTTGVTSAPTLTMPTDNAVDINIPSTTLTWDAVTEADTYTVETATDNGFTMNTTSNTVNVPTYDFGGLMAATQYFWRVRTTNFCGDSVYSSIFNFTTVFDTDNDGILDDVDNCVNTANPGQEDADGNGIGDACQDTDADTILDINDNCPTVANTDQSDVDGNGIGDLCQDTDGDGVLDIDDNCPLTANSGQEDENNDGIGDVCESVEPRDAFTPNGDGQNDGWHIENIENVTNTVKVFNRHGVKVFEASNYVNDSWNGESTEGGSGLLPAGSYYYVVEYTSTQGEAKVVKGWMYINY